MLQVRFGHNKFKIPQQVGSWEPADPGASAAGVSKGGGRCENHIGPGQGTREALTLSEKERFAFHKNYMQNTSSTNSGN